MNPPAPSRRDVLHRFLAGAGAFAFTAAARPFGPFITPAGAAIPSVTFPQGVASGDPQPGGIVLWTRIADANGEDAAETIDVTAQIGRDATFASVIAEKTMRVGPDSDHTLRLYIDGLEKDAIYFYRFVAAGVASPVGRTWTAPDARADRPVTLAVATCQSYEQGFYSAYRRMIEDDLAAPDDRKIDVVVHLGDFIYEGIGRLPRDESGKRRPLVSKDGTARTIPPLPDGTKTENGRSHAATLADYRHLYKTYLSDPDLQAARARWPFVQTWNDHEFSDDAWQAHDTYDGPGVGAQRRKVAANQAWFEYVPALLTGAGGVAGVEARARDFAPADVDDAAFDRSLPEPNNLAAVGSISIYRSLRLGKNVELVMTDERSYRSDHAVPEEVAMEIAGTTRSFLPVRVVRALDAGRTHNGGNPLSRILYRGKEIPNPRTDDPPGTMLGAEQKAWWKETMLGSDARFRIWANSVPLMPLRTDYQSLDDSYEELIGSGDAWDGYPTERKELMSFLRDNRVGPVVSLAGDHHMHMAGMVHEDHWLFEAPPVMPEFAVAGVSSSPLFQALRRIAEGNPVLSRLVSYDGTRFGEGDEDVENLNMMYLDGTRSAFTAATTGNVEYARAKSNPDQNPHLAYVDTNANGFAVLRVAADGATATLVTIERPLVDRAGDPAPVRRHVRFRVVPAEDGGAPRLEGPEIEGAPPFPLA